MTTPRDNEAIHKPTCHLITAGPETLYPACTCKFELPTPTGTSRLLTIDKIREIQGKHLEGYQGRHIAKAQDAKTAKALEGEVKRQMAIVVDMRKLNHEIIKERNTLQERVRTLEGALNELQAHLQKGYQGRTYKQQAYLNHETMKDVIAKAALSTPQDAQKRGEG